MAGIRDKTPFREAGISKKDFAFVDFNGCQQPAATIDVDLIPGCVCGGGSGGWLVAQTLDGPFSGISKPIFTTEGSLATFFKNYKICTLLHRFNLKVHSFSISFEFIP